MPKELFGQSTVSDFADNDRIAAGQPGIISAKNMLYSRFKELFARLTGAAFTGQVTASNLSGGNFGDEVHEYTNLAAFPAYGVESYIYVDKATNFLYRWNVPTLAYVQIGGGGGGTDADAIHKSLYAEISGLTAKTAIVDNDIFLAENYESSPNAFTKIKVAWSSIKSVLKSYFDNIYATIENLGLKQQIFVGLDKNTPVTISIDYTTRILTVTPTGSTFNIYVTKAGVVTKYTKTGAQAFPAFTDTNGAWYFYFDSDGVATSTQVGWTDFAIVAPIYIMTWNSSKSPDAKKSISEFSEMHLNDISDIDHFWKHSNGAIWTSGGDSSHNRIVSGSPNASGLNTCFGLTTVSNMDDNLPYTVTNSTGGADWQQDLGMTTPASLTISNGGIFGVRFKGAAGVPDLADGTRFPFLWNSGSNRPEYVDTSGSRQLVTNRYFFVYFVYAIQDKRTGQAVRITPSYGEYNTIDAAKAITWSNVQAQDIAANNPEIRVLYRLIFEYRNTYDVDVKYTALRDVQDLRKQTITQATNTGGSFPANQITRTAYSWITSLNVEGALQQIADTYFVLELAISYKDADIEAGTSVAFFTIPENMTVVECFIRVSTAPVGAAAVWDVNVGGSTILSTKITIDAGEYSSLDAGTQPVLSTTSLNKDGAGTVDCDQTGSSTKPKNAILTILYNKR